MKKKYRIIKGCSFYYHTWVALATKKGREKERHPNKSETKDVVG